MYQKDIDRKGVGKILINLRIKKGKEIGIKKITISTNTKQKQKKINRVLNVKKR